MGRKARSTIDTDEYRELRDEWYDRLEDEGFKDIEFIDRRHGGPGDYLRGVSAGDLRRNSRRIANVRETLAYYEACRARVHDLPPGLERGVWRMYAEGATKVELYAAYDRLGVTRAEIDRIVARGHEEVLRSAKEDDDVEGLE